MAVQATDSGPGSATLPSADDHIGRRIVVILSTRSEGITSEMTAPAWDWTLVHSEETLPLSSSDRRSISMWEAIVPGSALGSTVISGTWNDDSDTAVDTRLRFIVVDEDASYTLDQTAAADTGSGTDNELAIGPTATVSAGDHLVIAAATVRGHLDGPQWATTDLTPPNPGGGDWNLLEQNGSSSTGIETAGGYLAVDSAGSVTYSDTYGDNAGTERMITGFVAVWSTGAGGAPQVTASIPLEFDVGGTTSADHAATASVPLDLDVAPATEATHQVTAAVPLEIDVAATTRTDHAATAVIDLEIDLSATTDAPPVTGPGQVAAQIPLTLALATTARAKPKATTSVPLELGIDATTVTERAVTAAMPLILDVTAIGQAEPIVTPPERTVTVSAESRRLFIAESRQLAVAAESRTLEVS